jgi:hypothetical protein
MLYVGIKYAAHRSVGCVAVRIVVTSFMNRSIPVARNEFWRKSIQITATITRPNSPANSLNMEARAAAQSGGRAEAGGGRECSRCTIDHRAVVTVDSVDSAECVISIYRL